MRTALTRVHLPVLTRHGSLPGPENSGSTRAVIREADIYLLTSIFFGTWELRRWGRIKYQGTYTPFTMTIRNHARPGVQRTLDRKKEMGQMGRIASARIHGPYAYNERTLGHSINQISSTKPI